MATGRGPSQGGSSSGGQPGPLPHAPVARQLSPALCRDRTWPPPCSLGLVLTLPRPGLSPAFLGVAWVSCFPEDLAQGPSLSLGAHTLCFPHGRVHPTVGFFPGPQALIL